MNVADCSVGNNPLAQVTKHTQQDRSLQHGNHRLGYGVEGGSAAQQFKSSEKTMSDVNRFSMNNFINGGAVSGGSGLKLGQSPIGRNMSISRGQNFSPSPEETGVLTSGTNGWSQEFYQQSNSSSPQQQGHSPRHGQQTPHQQHRMQLPYSTHMLSGPRMLMRASPGAGMMRQQQHENVKTNWDEQFKELETEVAENLKLKESEPVAEESAVEKPGLDEDIVIGDQYQSEFQEVWNSLQKDSEDLLPEDLAGTSAWETDYQKYISGRISGNMEYQFDEKNEFLHNPNAYEIGCILMENGAKLSEAALAFEAAVQEDRGHVDAWLKLGEVQTQNEKEINGICALEECLKLDPNNLEAMKTLAISYINEGYDVSAFTMLNRWAETRYPNLLNSSEGITLSDEDERFALNAKIRKQFLQIANRLPRVDPDVQLCLGLLFYADDDFDKTIDCFRAALSVNPNDELMWNRLGASLANSNRSEEAIQAYHKALQLRPSFVRARYNLAVSSINIGCYKEAAEYLLSALKMHEVEGAPLNGTVAAGNNNILETLKRAFVAMDRRDLLQKVKPGMDLEQFRGEFNF
ncbi:hypothetical protein HG537_0G01660 [Torulaspora globosa]|uniref:Uncharacterized protein n=1 Tax=Torulaspora globosa TaxID=48254 RepID=A0A7H9HZK0_9SACH|nr:hypothetical protein HG537_0G01660 [Torulaspora sp. CBS 2947]